MVRLAPFEAYRCTPNDDGYSHPGPLSSAGRAGGKGPSLISISSLGRSWFTRGTMKLPFLLGILITTVCAARAATESTAFSQADLMHIGVYYYPEAWPSNQWAR